MGNSSRTSFDETAFQDQTNCSDSCTCSPQLALYFRTLCAAIASNLTYSDFKILSDWLRNEPLFVSEFPDNGAIYTPLALEIYKCLPTHSTSTNFYQIQWMLGLVLTSIPIQNQMQLLHLLTSSQDMKEQLIQGFANSATAHFSRYIRARENSNSPDYEQPIEQKNHLSPQLLSRMAMLLERESKKR